MVAVPQSILQTEDFVTTVCSSACNEWWHLSRLLWLHGFVCLRFHLAVKKKVFKLDSTGGTRVCAMDCAPVPQAAGKRPSDDVLSLAICSMPVSKIISSLQSVIGLYNPVGKHQGTLVPIERPYVSLHCMPIFYRFQDVTILLVENLCFTFLPSMHLFKEVLRSKMN